MVVQYQMPSDASLPTAPEGNPAPRSFAKPNEGMTRVVHDTGVGPVVPSREGFASNASDKGILETAHASGGRPVLPGEINNQTLVKIDGIGTTTVMSAMIQGYLKIGEGGQLVETGKKAVDPSAAQEPEGTDKTPEEEPNTRLDDESEAHLSEALGKAPEETIGIAEAAIKANGEMPAAHLDMLASRLGIEPAEAQERYEHVRLAYYGEAQSSLAETFGEQLADEAFDWARAGASNPDTSAQAIAYQTLQKSASQHFQTGKPAYEDIGREYVKHLAKTNPKRIVEDLKAGGREARLEGNKIVYRGEDGVEREFISAMLAGHILKNKGLKKRSGK